MRILIVEDERKTAAFIRKALQAEGFAVDVVDNGIDALTANLTTSFDAMVLDIMLPGQDGLSVLRQLRDSASIPAPTWWTFILCACEKNWTLISN